MNASFLNIIKKIIISLLFFLCYRAIFFIYFFPADFSYSHQVLKAFYIGSKFDIRLICVILLLGLIFKLIRIERFTLKLKNPLLFFIALCYFVDFATMSYVNQRANVSLLKLATEGTASFGMLWESYPILRCLLLILMIIFAYNFVCKKFIKKIKYYKVGFVSYLFSILLLLLGIYGQLDFYPLRWSDAYFSSNHFITQFSLNPILYFINTYGFRKDDFNKDAAAKFFPVMKEYLNLSDLNKELDYSRIVNEKESILPKKTNVVIIVLESLAHFKTGMGGNNFNPTPFFDSFAAESLYYDRFFVPSQATARSIFSLVTGIPDVASNKTSSRNPKTVEHNCLMNQMKGYEKYYFLGGSANWGNIEGLFGRNIENIIIKDGNFEAPRIDVWGISDYHLFEEAHHEFEKVHRSDKPFVAIVQSSGYHRPFTVTDKVPGFKKSDSSTISKEDLAKNGHSSLEELDSLRFQDYAFGHFLELAKKSSYYSNTVFLVFGDHGLPHENAQHVKKGYQDLLLTNWHVPFIIHSKLHIAPQTTHQLASELDVFPTVMGLLGMPYVNTTLGLDLFDSEVKNRENRFVFTYSWWARPTLFGLVADNYYYQGNHENIGDIYKYETKTNLVPESLIETDKYKKMEDMARAIFETARYMLYHNKVNPKQKDRTK